MDESITVLRGLSGGEWFEFHGEFYDIPAAKMAPAAHIPILIGGHGEPALKRAARAGDGWMHGGGDLSKLPALLKRVADLRKEYGRDEQPFEVHVISMDAYTPDGVKRLEDTGVTDVIVGFRWPYHVGPDPQPLQEKLDLLRRFADDVIEKVKT
jgi:alkanesulfonate monooxygenase SsuD/methylene tetrahydromethanopterin reductase-like flavin-dependent oxidoreductase (luciferase family)